MLRLYNFTLTGHTLFRSYGIILPSSLTGVLSKTLEYSSFPHESVLVRSSATLRAKLFSEAWNQSLYEPYDSRTHSSALAEPLFVSRLPTSLNRQTVWTADLSFFVPPRFTE